jgi:hypothetical protein
MSTSSSAGFVECLHDLRLVWALEIRSRLAALESDRGFMGDRATRILPGGAGESPRLWPVLGIPAQDHSRGRHAGCLHRIRGYVPEGETRVELSRGVRPFLAWPRSSPLRSRRPDRPQACAGERSPSRPTPRILTSWRPPDNALRTIAQIRSAAAAPPVSACPTW